MNSDGSEAKWISDLVSPIRMTFEQFEEAKSEWGEYSCSLPSGVIPGKKWLRQEPWGQDRWGNGPFHGPVAWYIGQYGPAFVAPDGVERCQIFWARVDIVEEWPGKWWAERKGAVVRSLRPSP